MRHGWMRGMTLAGLLILGLPLRSGAEPPADDKPPRSGTFRSATIWDKLFPSDHTAQHKPMPRTHAKPLARTSAHRSGPEPKFGDLAGAAGARLDREEKAYLRRQAVCDKLHEIAAQTYDEELEHRVHQLDERIWTIYSQRTHNLSAGDAVADMDEAILDKHLGGHGVAAPTHPISSKDRDAQAAVREERR